MRVAAPSATRPPFACQRRGDWLCGPWRRPVNNSSHEAGTIHDDATAQRLGYARGPVAGSIHFEQFVPLLHAAFGAGWSSTGCLSLWFDTPAFDGQALQAALADDAAAQRAVRAVRLQRDDGTLIAHGSACAGVDPAGEVRQRQRQGQSLARQQPGELPRLLVAVRPGALFTQRPVRVAAQDVLERLPLLTECLPEHHASAGRAAQLPMASAIHALLVQEADLPLATAAVTSATTTAPVGLFGAIEWQWLAGPMWAEHDYTLSAQVLAVGTSPRSEMLWTESTLHDPALGQDVARLLMLSRLLKQSSALWNPGDLSS